MEALNGFGGTGVSRPEAVRETVGMKRWMRQAARKHSQGKPPANDSAKAAGDAIAQLLKDARRHT